MNGLLISTLLDSYLHNLDVHTELFVRLDSNKELRTLVISVVKEDGTCLYTSRVNLVSLSKLLASWLVDQTTKEKRSI